MVAKMIEVPVRDGRMVDLLFAGDLFEDLDDAVTVAAIVVRVPGIDEECLTCRRDEQGGSAPFDIDEVDIKAAVLIVGLDWTSDEQAEHDKGTQARAH